MSKSNASLDHKMTFRTTIFLALLMISPLWPGMAAKETKIVVLGDSLTEGYGLSKDQAFPALLEKKLVALGHQNIKVLNSGVSGSTTAGGISRVDWVLKSHPDFVIVALGSNDGLRGLKPSETKKNLEKIIGFFKSKKVRVILAGMKMPPNYGSAFRKEFDGLFADVAKKEDVAFFPFLLGKVAGQSHLNLPDGIHPNEKGHATIADELAPFVSRVLKEKVQ